MDIREPVLRSLAMIEENIQEKLTVKTLADGIHFSRYHYQRLFREAVGESVMRYVQRRRLLLAAGELAGTRESILSIALRYGYDSHEGFIRAFKAQMGVTPTEYRKYHLQIASPKMQKEKCAMIYGKTADGIIRELNALIVQAQETAEETRKCLQAQREGAAFYGAFWTALADRAQEMARQLGETLGRIGALAQHPDAISARFMLIKAIEDAAFLSSITAFHAGLTMARAEEAHRAAFLPLCGRYDNLARNARLGAEKVVGLFRELSALIFQDMREGARRHLEAVAGAGAAAAKELSDPALPYGYIARELSNIADELEELPLENLALCDLEDARFRLEIIALSAGTDSLREPDHRPLFEGIAAFRERIDEAAAFFQSLPEGALRPGAEGEPVYSVRKKYADLAFQGNILLFYLRGEIQKLGLLADEGIRAGLEEACEELNGAIRLCGAREPAAEEIRGALQSAYEKISGQAGALGKYGGAIRFIAEQVGRLVPPVH